jgi:hypothetical protein
MGLDRRTHWTFRGLLGVHLRYGLPARCIAKRFICLEGSDGFVSSPRRFDSYRLERTSCRGELHPLKTNTFYTARPGFISPFQESSLLEPWRAAFHRCSPKLLTSLFHSPTVGSGAVHPWNLRSSRGKPLSGSRAWPRKMPGIRSRMHKGRGGRPAWPPRHRWRSRGSIGRRRPEVSWLERAQRSSPPNPGSPEKRPEESN